ncbi:hypothetical protein NKR23_g9023 [Pleurostoma richardsiae]|uniref:Uncharacterized protein n=1 Tax=Pleurostoma richardsiae TaxID=41990 RepID=A0AA38R5A6_9PEZI|nr:hypothetical protein NKR23_g9023 [Pleurostoma richardsiae]
MKALPREMWRSISAWLPRPDMSRFLRPQRSDRDAATRRQLDHLNLWTSIFRDDSWIGKVLSRGIYPTLVCVDSSYRILMLAGGESTESRHESRFPDDLLPSLRSSSFCLDHLEVAFPDFTLNVQCILEPVDIVGMPDPRNLFPAGVDKFDVTVAYYMAPFEVCTEQARVFGGVLCIVVLSRFGNALCTIQKGRMLEPQLRRLTGKPLQPPGPRAA